MAKSAFYVAVTARKSLTTLYIPLTLPDTRLCKQRVLISHDERSSDKGVFMRGLRAIGMSLRGCDSTIRVNRRFSLNQANYGSLGGKVVSVV